jgi:hypothetical protein
MTPITSPSAKVFNLAASDVSNRSVCRTGDARYLSRRSLARDSKNCDGANDQQKSAIRFWCGDRMRFHYDANVVRIIEHVNEQIIAEVQACNCIETTVIAEKCHEDERISGRRIEPVQQRVRVRVPSKVATVSFSPIDTPHAAILRVLVGPAVDPAGPFQFKAGQYATLGADHGEEN